MGGWVCDFIRVSNLNPEGRVPSLVMLIRVSGYSNRGCGL